MIGPRSVRGLLGVLLAAGLLVSVATPVVAIESGGGGDCAAVIGSSPSGARGYVDSRGVVREPVAGSAMKEVPTRQQNRGGPGFSATVNVYVHVITSDGEERPVLRRIAGA